MSNDKPVYNKSKAVITRALKPETLIVPIRAGQANLNEVYLLNEVAGRMWQLIDGKRTAKQIITTITQEYEVSTEEAWADFEELIKQLEDRAVISQAGQI